jgi:hypothetical protein
MGIWTRKTEADDWTNVDKTNNQEHNIMKVFSAGRTSGRADDFSIMNIAVSVMLILFLMFIILVYILTSSHCKIVITDFPHATSL